MMLKKKAVWLGMAGLGLVALSGCGSVTTVKDVTSDKLGYLGKKFSTASLSPSVAAKLPNTSPESSSKQFTMIFDVTLEESDGKKESRQQKVTYLPQQSGGLVQQFSESLNNGIPYSMEYSLSYRGFLGLRWQTVPLQGSMTGQLFEMKSVTQFDAIPTTTGQQFTIDYTSGTDQQFANFLQSKRVCTVTGTKPAIEIYAKLSGIATTFDCEVSSNNTVHSRSQWAVLPGYNVAVVLAITNSSRKVIFKLANIQG